MSWYLDNDKDVRWKNDGKSFIDDLNGLAQFFNSGGHSGKLYLANNQIGDNGIKELAPHLSKLTNLTKLGLGNNQISENGIKELAPHLSKLTNLTELYLGNNQIGDNGIKELAPHLSKLTNLTDLDLSGNKIGDNGIKELAPHLSKLTNLTELSLSGNNIGDSAKQQCDAIIKRNKDLKLRDQFIKDQEKELLEAKKKEADLKKEKEALEKQKDELNQNFIPNPSKTYDNIIDRDKATALKNKGKESARVNKYDEAISFFGKALSFDPDYPDAKDEMARALISKGKEYHNPNPSKNYDEALICYNKALEFNPKDSENILKLKNDALKDQGLDFKAEADTKPIGSEKTTLYYKALKCFEQILESEKFGTAYHAKSDILKAKGRILFEQGKYDKSLECFEKAIEINGKDIDAYDAKGKALYGLGKFDEAIKVLDNALDINSLSTFILNMKGYVLYKFGKFDEAKKIFNEVIAIDKGNALAQCNLGYIAYNLGYIAYNDGSDELACTRFKKSYDLNPKDLNCINKLALSYYAQADYENALSNYNLVVNSDNPTDVQNTEAFDGKGNILYQQKEYKKALNAYNTAIKSAPNNPLYYAHRGTLICTKTDARHQGEEDLKKARELMQDKNNYKDLFDRDLKFIKNTLDSLENAQKEEERGGEFSMEDCLSFNPDNDGIKITTNVIAKELKDRKDIQQKQSELLKQKQDIERQELELSQQQIDNLDSRLDSVENKLKSHEKDFNSVFKEIGGLSRKSEISASDISSLKNKYITQLKSMHSMQTELEGLSGKVGDRGEKFLQKFRIIEKLVQKLQSEGELTEGKLNAIKADLNYIAENLDQIGGDVNDLTHQVNVVKINCLTESLYDNPLLNDPEMLSFVMKHCDGDMSRSIDLGANLTKADMEILQLLLGNEGQGNQEYIDLL